MRDAARRRKPPAGRQAPGGTPARPPARRLEPPPAAARGLQREAGNSAVSALLRGRAGDRPAPRTQAVQRDEAGSGTATGTIGGLAVGMAGTLLAGLRGADLGRAAVLGLVAMGVRGENDLTNLVFWARHPEAALRKIQPHETALAADWVRIRREVVRPALRDAGGNGDGAGGSAGPGAGATPAADRPAGGGTPEPSGGGIGPDRLGGYGDAEATRFRKAVYARQLERNRERKKEFFPGLPVAELDTVDGHRLHVDAAGDARSLLAAARADLAAAQEAGDPDALKVRSIGIGSAYRDPERDFRAWKNAFDTHYNGTAGTRAGLDGGPHGPAAVSLMVSRMVQKKAVPGFSNHTKGLAIDFSTTQGTWTFGASSSQSAGWVKTWLYRWLQANAGTYRFHPYAAEPWHWDHRA